MSECVRASGERECIVTRVVFSCILNNHEIKVQIVWLSYSGRNSSGDSSSSGGTSSGSGSSKGSIKLVVVVVVVAV